MPALSLHLADLPELSPAVGEPATGFSTSESAGPTAAERERTDSSTPRRGWRRLLLVVGRALLVVALVRTFIGEASVVPTGSMEGTILIGDHLFWDKAFYGPEIPFTHWRLPQLKRVHRGEIVAFRYPGDVNQIFLKRVVALGGDHILIRDGVLYVNGAPMQENYARHTQPVARFEQMASRTVPEGELFMLGDNRDNSSDSRDWGAVPVQNVIGSPLFIFWSYDAPSAAWLDSRPASRLRFYGSIARHMFSRTRWSRMGTLF